MIDIPVSHVRIPHPLLRLPVLLVGALVIYIALSSGSSILAHRFKPPIRDLIGGCCFIITAVVMIGAYRAVLQWLDGRVVSELPWRPGIGLPVGFGLGAALIVAAQIVELAAGAAHLVGAEPGVVLLTSLLLMIGIAVGEEIIFRGILYRGLRDAWGVLPAALVSAALFGAIHLLNKNATPLAGFAIAVEAGLMLCLAYEWSRTLWMPIGIHLGWNYLEGPVLGGAVSGDGGGGLFHIAVHGSPLLTGGAFGLEASVQAMALGTITALLFAVAIRRRRSRTSL